MNKTMALMSVAGLACSIIAVGFYASAISTPAPSLAVKDTVCATLDTYPEGSQAKADAREYVRNYYNVECP